jgi:hypothetical protein
MSKGQAPSRTRDPVVDRETVILPRLESPES